MVLASGTKVRLSYFEEVTRGVTPAASGGPPTTAPVFKTLRATERNPQLEINTLESAEVRADREISDLRHGFNRVSGSMGYELSGGGISADGPYDDFIQYLLGGTWAAEATSGAIAFTVNAAGKTFTKTGGTNLTTVFKVGDIVKASNFANAANNGAHVLTAVAADVATVASTDLVNETGGGTTVLTAGEKIKPGTVLKTVSLERGFLDIDQYQLFKGVSIDTMSLSAQPEAIIGGTFGFVGMSSPVLAAIHAGSGTGAGGNADGTPTAAPTGSPYAAFDGQLVEGGVLQAVVTGVEINIANNRTVNPVIGSKFSPDVFDGRIRVTGTLSAYFENATLFNKFVSETSSTLSVVFTDPNGANFMGLVLPKVKYTGGEITPGQEGPVPMSMPFAALTDAVQGSILFQRI